ncbi:MAG: xanthine dehydrogenase family protein subunit M [Anaerolineales bacterium]|nr:xanthine dehydrogenase family protein subunit M [Anaerolineales bacterium]
MKPSSFEYFAPRTLEKTIELLEQYGDDAKIIAGGQSLVPLMNFRLGRPGVLIDINRIRELEFINEDDDKLEIGALTRERDLEISPLVQRKCPILPKAISFIGHVAIRNRGTIGGSLAHADPSAEIPVIARCLDAEITVIGSSGERKIKSDEFFLTYLTTSLSPSEILIGVKIPILHPKMGWSFLELSRRSGDFAIVAVAIVLVIEEDGLCSEARICLGGVAPTPVRPDGAEQLISGQLITDELIDMAAQEAVKATDAESDYHATADYRREMVRVFVKRGLNEAWNRVTGGNANGKI